MSTGSGECWEESHTTQETSLSGDRLADPDLYRLQLPNTPFLMLTHKDISTEKQWIFKQNSRQKIKIGFWVFFTFASVNELLFK